MTATDQNPYEPPQEASRLAPTAQASIIKKPPWRIWKRLCLSGIAMFAIGFSVVFGFTTFIPLHPRDYPMWLFAIGVVSGCTYSLGALLVIVFGPIWLIQSLLRFMRNVRNAPRTPRANFWVVAGCVVGILVLSVFIYLWYSFWEAWRP